MGRGFDLLLAFSLHPSSGYRVRVKGIETGIFLIFPARSVRLGAKRVRPSVQSTSNVGRQPRRAVGFERKAAAQHHSENRIQPDQPGQPGISNGSRKTRVRLPALVLANESTRVSGIQLSFSLLAPFPHLLETQGASRKEEDEEDEKDEKDEEEEVKNTNSCQTIDLPFPPSSFFRQNVVVVVDVLLDTFPIDSFIRHETCSYFSLLAQKTLLPLETFFPVTAGTKDKKEVK